MTDSATAHERLLARLRAPGLRKRLEQRATLHRAIRASFDAAGFLEVETGQLVDEPGQEPTLDPFRCGSDVASEVRYLITSPELRMKQLLAAGYGRIYELSHCFRSGLGETSPLHNPEFTLLEWYRANEGEDAIAHDVERTIVDGARALGVGDVLVRGEHRVRIDSGLERMSVRDAFDRYAGVDLEPFLDGDAAGFRAACSRAGIADRPTDVDATSLFFRVMLDRVEPRLGTTRPTLLHSYPASMAALARIDSADPRIARRFELYIAGVELANGFVELTDANEQRARFVEERKVKVASGRDPGVFPDRFLRALAHGMPPACGIALGVDRLLMLLSGAASVTELLAFPEAMLRET